MAGRGHRRVVESVTYALACERVLEFLNKGPARKSVIAYAIWPDTNWLNPQGAAFSAAKIVRRMCDERLITSCKDRANWGHYMNTNFGCAEKRK
jgi:hypothetical protein